MMTNTIHNTRAMTNPIGNSACNSIDGCPRTSDQQLEATMQLMRYSKRTGLPFLLVDAKTGAVVEQSDPECPQWLPSSLLERLPRVSSLESYSHPSGIIYYMLPMLEIDENKMVAVTFAPTGADVKVKELSLATLMSSQSNNWEQWFARQPYAHPDVIRRLLETAINDVQMASREQSLQFEIVQLTGQIERTYEEISLLHSLTHNLQISRPPLEVAQLCLDRMEALIPSECNAIWLEDKNAESRFLINGNSVIDEIGLARLISIFEDHDWSRPLVKNHLEYSPLSDDFPGLRNIVVAPIAEAQYRSGWILSMNQDDNREYGSVEASLLNSIATILGTHIRNIDLYQQHDELLLSFVRSLVCTLDAKDRYTRGHSDRVALIARLLAQKLNMPDDELHDIYLSGLLHDIGKIGVDDRIISKPGALTTEEFEKIKEHPMIGFQILQGLKNLQKILPGVRNHHEAYDGTGYPDKLSGEDIPFMARILAVADSYDAMSSDRPYRKGMPVERIEQIFQDGKGKQWDPKVIEVYFECRDEILKICKNYRPSDHDLLKSVQHETSVC